MKDPTVWADSKCSQRPKEEPAEDWNVQEDFLEVVELEQGSEVLIESMRVEDPEEDIVSVWLGYWNISRSYSLR